MPDHVTYDFNGVKHVRQGSNVRAVTGEEFEIFQKLKELEKQANWLAVRDLCEIQIQKTPEWLTPYLCAGVACANLGEEAQAIPHLEHVQKMANDNTDYAPAGRILSELRRNRD